MYRNRKSTNGYWCSEQLSLPQLSTNLNLRYIDDETQILEEPRYHVSLITSEAGGVIYVAAPTFAGLQVAVHISCCWINTEQATV